MINTLHKCVDERGKHKHTLKHIYIVIRLKDYYNNDGEYDDNNVDDDDDDDDDDAWYIIT